MRENGSKFRNEAISDFTVEANRQAFQDALAAIEKTLTSGPWKAAPIVAGTIINATERSGGEQYNRVDPSNVTIRVGSTYFANELMVEEALSSVHTGMHSWASTPAEERANELHEAARRMRLRRFELAALMVREAGKPWREADADVAEAIDFCDYYADEMTRLALPFLTQQVPGEDNRYFYQPRGLAVIISPWNFPLAIGCGMTVAALVTGNGAILKPAEQTCCIGFEFAKILLEAGVPKEAFAFLPGRGEVVGRALVQSPLVDLICFTGSKVVGLEINSTASRVQQGQKSIKRVIAELGGKNAIIIDEDADLDEAVKGVLASSFGYAGQKCSACSRVIIVGDAYETFLSRFCEAASDIIVGEAKNPATLLGPVIDEESQRRILETIDEAERNSWLAFKGNTPSGGYYVPATIFRDVDPKTTLWRQEVFGPVIACTKARDFSDALRLATDSEYALTGGVFSRSPANIERAKRDFSVGNLYINRGCTGALVGRQPFGGFRMSGVGSKAGGPDYLLQFLEPRVVTENTMRRGFAP